MKPCTKCNKPKQQDQYYQWKAKSHAKKRTDSICKTCRLSKAKVTREKTQPTTPRRLTISCEICGAAEQSIYMIDKICPTCANKTPHLEQLRKNPTTLMQLEQHLTR